MFNTELLVAWRYIKSRRREKFISITAMFSLLGIVLGVATLIIVTSVMNGFRKEFTDRVIGFNGHISLYSSTDFTKYEEVIEYIQSIPEVTKVIPIIERNGLISNNRSIRGSLCQGITPKDLSKKELISKNIVRGSLHDFYQNDAIVLGESLSERLNLNIGSEVIIIVPEMDETGFGFLPRKKTFKLIATFKSGMHEYDMSISFISLSIAQKLFKLPQRISTVSIFVKDPMKISEIKQKINEKFFAEFKIADWQSNNSSFMKAVEIERNVMYLILTLITLVASFNIISCMIMLVKDKEKDIAILRTIGLKKASITRIFFIIGSSIGATGTLVGSIVGILFSANIKKIQNLLEILFNTQIYSPEVYFLTNLPSLLCPSDVIITITISLLLSCLSTIYPARKAGTLNPTEILRYA